jgi:hypothetical protein
MKLYIAFCLTFSFFTLTAKSSVDKHSTVFAAIHELPFDDTTINTSYAQKFTLVGNLEPKVIESSGIDWFDNVIWTHNDSKNSNEIYKIDPSNGEVLQSITILNHYNIDWEDITSDSQYLYIGDFGNNKGDRENLMILKINKSQFNDTSSIISVLAEEIKFSYSDQQIFTPNSSSNFNCEAFFAKGDSLYLFSKNNGDYKTKGYALSKVPGVYSIAPIFEYDCRGLITGADYDALHDEVILIGYEDGLINSFIYYLSNFSSNQFFNGDSKRVKIGNSINQWQTEGICYGIYNEVYISCESSYVKASLYAGDKTGVKTLSITQGNKDGKEYVVFPNPVHTGDDLSIIPNTLFKTVSLLSLSGEIIIEHAIENEILLRQEELSKLSKGVYTLRLESEMVILTKKLTIN